MGARERRLAVAGIVLVAAACGGSDDDTAGFCDQADSFRTYQQGLADALFDPFEARVYFAGSVERISQLADDAPPTIADDVATVRDGFIATEATLASVGYDVLALSDEQLDTSTTDAASARIDEFLAAACREAGDPFTGFADDPFAPPVLLPDELADLEARVDDGTSIDDVVVAQLVEAFDLTGDEASCMLEGFDVSTLAAIAGGDLVTDDDQERFLAALDACGIDIDRLTS